MAWPRSPTSSSIAPRAVTPSAPAAPGYARPTPLRSRSTREWRAAVQFVRQPSATLAGQVIPPAVTVGIVDAFGNVVPGTTNSVTVALATNPGGAVLAG